MDAGTIITIVIGLIVVGVAAYSVATGKRNVYNLPTAIAAFRHAEELVATYAPAADQLVAIKALRKEDRLSYVIRMVMRFVSTLKEDEVRGIVEGYLANEKKHAAIKE